MTRLAQIEIEARARAIFEEDPPPEVEGDTWDTLIDRGTDRDFELIESYMEAARLEKV